MTDVENRHLVAIDAGSVEPRLVVCRPPQTLTRQEALTFAAHLVATTNAARGGVGGPSPLDFARAVKAQVGRVDGGVSVDATTGRVVLAKSVQTMNGDEALLFAAQLVAAADPDANMLERVNAIVEAARGGRALDAILKRHGHEVKLGAGTRTRLAIDVATREEHEAEEAAEESAMTRYQRRQVDR